MVTRRDVVTGGSAAALVAAFGRGVQGVAAITNPSLGLQQGDVTRLRNARDILLQVASVWSADGRYSGQVGAIRGAADLLDEFATEVENYLLVQGT